MSATPIWKWGEKETAKIMIVVLLECEAVFMNSFYIFSKVPIILEDHDVTRNGIKMFPHKVSKIMLEVIEQ
jgi:hypothetical protein